MSGAAHDHPIALDRYIQISSPKKTLVQRNINQLSVFTQTFFRVQLRPMDELISADAAWI